MQLNLSGKTALITGGSHGIGLAIKKALEVEGVKVDIISRTEGIKMDLSYEYPVLNKNYDILINNIGGGGTWDWIDSGIMSMNYENMASFIYEFLKQKKKWGKVITISSIYGKEKGPNPGFAATKASQIAFMKSMAGKYKGITFNTICPGCINTKPSIKKYAKENNMTLGKPEDVANIVTFLCSDLASHINGTTITVDGGDSHAF